MPSKALLFLFFRSKMIFIEITCQMVDHITSFKILSGMFITLGTVYLVFSMFCRSPPKGIFIFKGGEISGKKKKNINGRHQKLCFFLSCVSFHTTN